MLSSGVSSSQITYSNPKQIAVGSNTSSQVLYTVPAGRKFQGTIHSYNAGQSVGITPSGGVALQFQVPSVNTSYTTANPMPVTLVSGSIFTNYGTGGYQYLIGVETDA